MALLAKVLGGVTNAAIGATGSVASKFATKNGAIKIGAIVGTAQKEVDKKVASVVTRDAAYKATKAETRGLVKEAKNTTSKVAEEAISKGTKSKAKIKANEPIKFEGFSHDASKGTYSATINGGKEIPLTEAQYNMHIEGKTDELNKQIAEQISQTATGDGAGVNLQEFIQEHPVMSMGGAAVGGALIGNMLDDD